MCKVKTDRPFLKTSPIGYGMRLRQIMLAVLKNDDKLPGYSTYVYIKGSKYCHMITPEGVAIRQYKDWERAKSLTGAAMKYAALYTHEAMIGFVAYTPNPMPLIHAFALTPEHRTEVNKAKLLATFGELFKGGNYGVFVHRKNIRAIRFLECNGYKQAQVIKSRKGVILSRE